MSVLIRRMALPKNCEKCQFCVNGFTDEVPQYECAACGDDMTSVLVDDHGKPYDIRPDWCPLEEIKEPFGRLIDADALNIYDISPVNGFCVMGVTEEDIGLAKTVIEGSETDA